MAERPIIFGTWAIPKLLDGSKTQTRRTRGLEEINKNPDEWVQPYQLDVDPQLWTWRSIKTGEVITIKCPYGQVGDKLWVRETFDTGYDNVEGTKIFYKADFNNTLPKDIYEWKPSIHMPRWASRITLEITEVRGERLQEITFDDVVAEGLNPLADCHGTQNPTTEARWLYQELWDSLNTKRYPWSTNPWEWPITFELVI